MNACASTSKGENDNGAKRISSLIMLVISVVNAVNGEAAQPMPPCRLPVEGGTSTQGISAAELGRIVSVVSEDDESKRRIQSVFGYLPPGAGIAGSVRNALLVCLGADSGKPEIAAYSCVGIGDATSNAIARAVTRGDWRVGNVRTSFRVDRDLKDVAHSATQVVTKCGDEFVLDWHQTLDINNPMVYMSASDWKSGSNGVPFKTLAR